MSTGPPDPLAGMDEAHADAYGDDDLIWLDTVPPFDLAPLTPARLAYMAGLIDALGRLRARSTDAAVLPEVSISTARIELLQTLADATGVRVVTVDRDYLRLGCSEHCTQRHQHVASLTGRWQVTGYRATVVLLALAPYLVRHQRDAQAMIVLGLRAGHQARVREDMARLGWPLPVDGAP